jgi:menaquinone-dependent protoporphyrinogen oxidase
MVHVLIAYGSKMGGTKGLAEMVARELEGNGLAVDVVPAREVRDIEPYDAVIVGGALYSLRWHKDARWFVKRYRTALAKRPLWLFSSGPLDDSAREKEIPPVRFVGKTMDQLGARGHMTFGGRMPAEATGFPAGSMAKNNPGDWRNPDQVRDWAKHVAEDLHAG